MARPCDQLLERYAVRRLSTIEMVNQLRNAYRVNNDQFCPFALYIRVLLVLFFYPVRPSIATLLLCFFFARPIDCCARQIRFPRARQNICRVAKIEGNWVARHSRLHPIVIVTGGARRCNVTQLIFAEHLQKLSHSMPVVQTYMDFGVMPSYITAARVEKSTFACEFLDTIKVHAIGEEFDK